MAEASVLEDYPFSPKQEAVDAAGDAGTNVSARRIKKREIDRRCQRQARERTKSRIAYLEGLVENLKHSDSDERSAALMQRLAEAEKERDALAQTVKEVQKALLAHKPTETRETYVKNEQQPQHAWSLETRIDRPITDRQSSSDMTPPSAGLEQTGISSQGGLHTQAKASNGVHHTTEEIGQDLPKVCNDACEMCQDTRDASRANLWRAANNTLLQRYSGPSPITPEEDYLAEDTPVRVVMEGWDAVEQRFGLATSWKILRRIDEMLFAKCPPTERLAILSTMHLLLQSHMDPTAERRAKLPPWFLPRPSQAQPHSYAIDYFVWPGLRERFIFEQHKFCSNLFWQTFSPSLHISWPYDFRDCFVQRSDTGLIEMSSDFKDCIKDISRWTMKPDFFENFPVLRADIPSAILSPRPCSTLLQLQGAMAKPQTRGSVALNGSFGKSITEESNNSLSEVTGQAQWASQSTSMPWLDPTGFSNMYMNHTVGANWVG